MKIFAKILNEVARKLALSCALHLPCQPGMLILTSFSFLTSFEDEEQRACCKAVQQSLVFKFISAFQVEHFLQKIQNFVFAVFAANIICLKDMTFLIAFPRKNYSN